MYPGGANCGSADPTELTFLDGEMDILSKIIICGIFDNTSRHNKER